MAVWWDMLIQDLSQTIKSKSKEVVSIYEDADDSLKQDQGVVGGHIKNFTVDPKYESTAESTKKRKPHESAPNIWDNFYSKLAEIDVSKSKALG